MLIANEERYVGASYGSGNQEVGGLGASPSPLDVVATGLAGKLIHGSTRVALADAASESTGLPIFAPRGKATVDELVDMMNKRPGTKAEYATGDAKRYMEAIRAEGSHLLDEAGNSSILLRKDVATRHTALHEWLHRHLQRKNGGPIPGEEDIIESFLERHKDLFKLND